MDQLNTTTKSEDTMATSPKKEIKKLLKEAVDRLDQAQVALTSAEDIAFDNREDIKEARRQQISNAESLIYHVAEMVRSL
ncbi:hypothetical protein SEA_REINDEER_8 [Mycobacterium phage Reindeer]|uniref:Uncharacterized protein n=1 Tax=Mycobacterium phage Reindeer TaxID=2762283 RepID=A0A7G8LHU6_9CAUD|nr:hypothetical protein J4U05_gp008 [Mycobacterium phage Reindeer]QNJ56818.1 hypothetical protein SEA_REINDEER_8 [Mycobacterium phage Reindeer]